MNNNNDLYHIIKKMNNNNDLYHIIKKININNNNDLLNIIIKNE